MVLVMCIGDAPAWGQPPFPSQRLPQTTSVPGVPPMLDRIDPLYGDASPLSHSLREMDMQADLRSPVGFQNIYRVPGRDDLLMRQSGGVYAIFPQSAYVPSRNGSIAVVPPGTIYSIGPPGMWSMPSQWVQPPALAHLDAANAWRVPSVSAEVQLARAGTTLVDRRRQARRETLGDSTHWIGDDAQRADEVQSQSQAPRYEINRATPPEPSTFLTTIVTNDAYRASRLAELLEQAMRAAQRSNDQ